MSFHLEVPRDDEDVVGFLFEVREGAGEPAIESEYVELEEELFPSRLLPEGGPTHRFADAYFVLEPGDYFVTVTPMRDASTASEDCAPASKWVAVEENETTEVTLISQCEREDNGALDIVVLLNHPPRIVDLELAPSKFIRSCEWLEGTISVEDIDGDELTFAWEIVTSPPGALFAFEPDGDTFRFVSMQAGDFEAKGTVCDPFDACAHLTFPIHVSLSTDADGDGIGDECEFVERWSVNDDFDEAAETINVVWGGRYPNDRIQLDDTTQAFDFMWVAVSSKGTVVKIDTRTGQALGEYSSSPFGRGRNPSRTTVDQNGNVWVANRDEFGWVDAGAIGGIPASRRQMGSIIHIGLVENGQCVDRNGNGVIDTSTGLDDIRSWSNTGGADDLGGVSTAADECILHYIRVNGTGTRHLSVDADGNVWVGGYVAKYFDLVDGATGAILRQEPPVGTPLPTSGGYGGLIDENGVIWSSRPSLLRWDPASPLTPGNYTIYQHDSYGLCIDSYGNVWNTSLYDNQIRKFAPDGTLLGVYQHGDDNAQGCVVDGDDHVWVAHVLWPDKNTVGHLLDDGTFVGNVTLDPTTAAGPTGVAVDRQGYVWATGFLTHKVYKIDPAAGSVGGGGAPVGATVFATVDLGGELYNYSDMTGSTVTAPPDVGTWKVIHDAGEDTPIWGRIDWTAFIPGDSAIEVAVAGSDDGIDFEPDVVLYGPDTIPIVAKRYVRISVTFARSNTDLDRDGINDSPILYDLTVRWRVSPHPSN